MLDDDESYYEAPDRKVSYKDQLVYRVTIQKIVERCLFLQGSEQFHRPVESLRTALYFSIPGLPFKSRIDTKITALETERQQYIQDFCRNRYHNRRGDDTPQSLSDLTVIDRVRVTIRLYNWYNSELLEFLLNLLAEHDALIKARDLVPEGTRKKETAADDTITPDDRKKITKNME